MKIISFIFPISLFLSLFPYFSPPSLLFFFFISSCHLPSSSPQIRHSLSLSLQRTSQELHKNTLFFFKKLPKVTHYQFPPISFFFFFILILDLWIFHLGHGWTVSEPRSRRSSVVILVFSGSRASLHPIEGIKVSFPLFSCLVCEFEVNMRVEVKPRVEFLE